MEIGSQTRMKPERSPLAVPPDSGRVLPGEPDKQHAQIGDDNSTEFAQGLHITSNPYRSRIILALCAVVDADKKDMDAKLTVIPEKLLRACDCGSTLLSVALQTKFVDKRTPLGWLFDNLPDSIVHSDPEEVSYQVLAAATQGLLASYWNGEYTAAKDLIQSCCRRNINMFFQRELNEFKKSSTCETTYQVDLKKKVHAINGPGLQQNGTVEFTIPNFRQRMLLDGFVDIRFIFWQCLWSYRIHSSGGEAWHVKCTIVDDPLNINLPREMPKLLELYNTATGEVELESCYRCATLKLKTKQLTDIAAGRLLFPPPAMQHKVSSDGHVFRDTTKAFERRNQYTESDGILRGIIHFSRDTAKKDIETNNYE
ncbi:hypothetical protein FA15DRAFT_657942 [Coprinopsis marcescibilis]|uniref:Uncharacterized protein n=1 Tax=Coprinopsis marcescibilis TaxID=230819 RepID=A0A5C3KNL5_COPMA|nr:hypothetical protein FA15DRAFT_657942 [Coprinopsis marcescibilis]